MTRGKESMYPIELSVDFDLSRSLWFQWIFWDPAYLYCVLFGASATHDFLKRTPSQLTHSHFKSAIKYLNINLSDTTLAKCDSTVAVVFMLAMVAGILGDKSGAKAHVQGLKWIVRQRGGLQGFRHDPKLHMKIGRVDLAYSLITGDNPLYLNDTISLAPILDPTILSSVSYGIDPTIYGLQDERVTTIFRELQYYSTVIDQVGVTHHKRPASEYQNVICSIQYRLMQLQGSLDSILAETLRLAMLAFLTTTFQISGAGFQYPYLAKRFQQCCLAMEATTPHHKDLMLWLLMIGAIAMYGVNDEWLRKRWQCDVPKVKWVEARHRLKRIMWIDAMHDQEGKRSFEALSDSAIVKADSV